MPAEFKKVQVARSSHITVLEPNKVGVDLVITDLHGIKGPLEQGIALLTRNDRIILGGDIIDRGPDSYQLCKLIIENNRQHSEGQNKPLIYAIRGNHEEDFLSLYVEMQKTTDKEKRLGRNGQLYQKTLNDKDRNWVTKLNDEQIQELAIFFVQLPYIVHVKHDASTSSMPYYVVHAGMPFNDEKLSEYHLQSKKLSQQQIDFVTLARTPTKIHADDKITPRLQPNGRDKSSILAICGHNAHYKMNYSEMIQGDLSTMIIDVSTPNTGIALGVFPNQCRVVTFGDPKDPKHSENASNAIGHLEKYLRTKHQKPQSLPKHIEEHLAKVVNVQHGTQKSNNKEAAPGNHAKHQQTFEKPSFFSALRNLFSSQKPAAVQPKANDRKDKVVLDCKADEQNKENRNPNSPPPTCRV